MMEKWRENRHSCGSFFVDNCNCEVIPENLNNFKLNKLNPMCSQYLHSNDIIKGNILAQNADFPHSVENSQQFQKYNVKTPNKTRRELRSFSHPAINFIFTRENRASHSFKEAEAQIGSSIVPLCHRISNQLHNKVETNSQDIGGNRKLQLIDFKNIDKAQQFFEESGILGLTNLSNSRDLIKKTSRIHLDLSLKSNIRRTSLCLMSRTFGEKCSPSTPKPEITLEDSNELIVRNIQRQVKSLKGIIETGETKIIMLRAEVNKIKRVLQEMMYVHSQTKAKLPSENPTLCVFCHEEPRFAEAMLLIKPHT